MPGIKLNMHVSFNFCNNILGAATIYESHFMDEDIKAQRN